MAEQNPQQLSVVLDQKQLAELQKSAPKILAQAQSFEIETVEDYQGSGSLLSLIDERQKKVMDFFDEPARQANSVHKFITNLRATLTAPYVQAGNLIRSRRQAFRQEEERKRREKEQEEQRIAQQQKQTEAVEEAAQLAAIGETEAADIVIERAASAPPPPVMVPSTIPKQAGLSVRKVWKFRVKNPDLIKREFLILDESKARTIVTKLGPDAVSIIGGIEVYEDEIETVRKK